MDFMVGKGTALKRCQRDRLIKGWVMWGTETGWSKIVYPVSSPMVIEQHPSLHSLSLEDKLQLSEELCLDALLDAERNPALRENVQRRLQEFRDAPDSGISWDDLTSRILSRQAVA